MGNLRFCGDISVRTISPQGREHRAYGFERLELQPGESPQFRSLRLRRGTGGSSPSGGATPVSQSVQRRATPGLPGFGGSGRGRRVSAGGRMGTGSGGAGPHL